MKNYNRSVYRKIKMQPLGRINKNLLLLKMHYFIGFAGGGATFPFLSTISKQRGYSPTIFSLINTVLLIPSIFARPAIGALTDKYKCGKSAIVLSAVFVSLLTCAMIFIPGSAADKKMDDVYVIKSPLFWLFLCTMTLFIELQFVESILEDTICVVLLGENKHNYGHQRVWGSIGWGVMSFLSGFCVDWYSKDQQYKDYTPCFVITSACSLLDAYVLTQIEVVQNSETKIVISNVGKLCTKIKVLVFFFWVVTFGIFSNIITNFIFWYMEDLANIYHPETKQWMKTIQGFSSAIQCIGGEIPFFFLSSFILKRIDHMTAFSLTFFAFAVKFFLYLIVENPVWILPIELLHGLTFALPYATSISYAAHIAPAGAEGMLQGIVGTVLMGIGGPAGTVVGGYFFDHFGSISSLKIISVIASVFCVLQIIISQLVNRLSKNEDLVEGSCENDSKINNHDDVL